ncbi:hypothetical protein KUTeg_011879 [Tegillarca granosa]|uniref:Uncharacterized protein n=1 Tax=Tegillarca granosa TaxID=220873 RepID=A0ABQ9EXX5_TEGGR|nr:hypothetical protein KUTeg_011879 [Tegillarca granosa]
MHLFLTNAQAQKHNNEKLCQLNVPIVTVLACDTKKDIQTQSSSLSVTSTNKHEKGGLAKELSIAIRFRWMHTKNTDIADKLCEKRAKKQSLPNLSHCVPVKAVTARFILSPRVPITVARRQ